MLKELHYARLQRAWERTLKGPGTCYRVGDTHSLQIHTVCGDAIGSIVWGGSDAILEYFLEAPELIRSKHILELGCGVGVVGLFLCKMGAAEVIMTDCAEHLALPSHNLAMNSGELVGPSCLCCVSALNWGGDSAWEQFCDKNREFVSQMEIVVGSDLVYTEKGALDLANLLSLIIPHGSSVVFIMSYLERGAGHFFFNRVREVGLAITTISKRGNHSIIKIRR